MFFESILLHLCTDVTQEGKPRGMHHTVSSALQQQGRIPHSLSVFIVEAQIGEPSALLPTWL